MEILTKDELVDLHDKIEKEFDKIEKNNGISISLRRTRFDSDRFSTSIYGTIVPNSPLGKAFNRDNMKSIRQSIQCYLNKIGNENGLKLELKNISFTWDSFSSKFEGVIKTREADIARKELSYLGNDTAAWLGQGFKCKHGYFTITGVNLRARKFQIEAKDRLGKGFRFKIQDVRKYLEITNHARNGLQK